MMKVYVLEFLIDYEQGHTVGVYSTKWKAQATAEKLRDSFYYSDPCITEYELDEVPEP